MNVQDLIGNPPPAVEKANGHATGMGVPLTIPHVEPATPAPVPPSIADDMAALQERLARSLNVEPNARGTYDATAFVTALEAVHGRFVQARASLSEWEATLEAREQKLAAREAALSEAEDRAAACLRLAKLMPEQPARKRWFGR